MTQIWNMIGVVLTKLLTLGVLAHVESLTCYYCEKWTIDGSVLSSSTDCLEQETAFTCNKGDVCIEGNHAFKYAGDPKEHVFEYFKGCEQPCEVRGGDRSTYSEYRCNETTCDTDLCNTMTLAEARDYRGVENSDPSNGDKSEGDDVPSEESNGDKSKGQGDSLDDVIKDESSGEKKEGDEGYQIDEQKTIANKTANNGGATLSTEYGRFILAVQALAALFSIM